MHSVEEKKRIIRERENSKLSKERKKTQPISGTDKTLEVTPKFDVNCFESEYKLGVQIVEIEKNLFNLSNIRGPPANT